MGIFLMSIIGLTVLYLASLILRPLLVKAVKSVESGNILGSFVYVSIFDFLGFLAAFVAIFFYMEESLSYGPEPPLTPIIFIFIYKVAFGGGDLIQRAISLVIGVIAFNMVF